MVFNLIEYICCELEKYKFNEMQGGAIPWQNVQFVKKAYITEIMSAILIEDPTKYGNQTSNV